MELRNIATFLCVAEKGSFTSAAEELGYVQSTVSVQIQQLEKEIGTPLFERIGRHISITPSGQCFLAYARQIMQVMEKSKLIGKQLEDIALRLRIGIVESLLEWIVLECIPTFHERFPKVSIETKMASGNDLFHMLKSNELDFVFVLDKKMAIKNCTRIFSASEDIVFVTHPAHPLVAKKQVLLRDILQFPLVLTEKASVYRKALDEIAAQKDMYVSPFLEVNNTSAIMKLLAKKAGISFLPEYAVRKDVAEGNLAILRVRDCPLQLWSQIFYSEDKWVTPQMNELIVMIQTYYNLQQCAEIPGINRELPALGCKTNPF